MNIAGTKADGGKYLRLGTLLLMMIFSVCSFALMWTAVSCFKRIREGYETASESLAAARFTANHVRGAQGRITVYSRSDGTLEKMVISRGDGYDNIITFRSGRLMEAIVPEGSFASEGEEIFGVKELYAEPADCGPMKITAVSSSGQRCVIYASAPNETEYYYPTEGGGSE